MDEWDLIRMIPGRAFGGHQGLADSWNFIVDWIRGLSAGPGISITRHGSSTVIEASGEGVAYGEGGGGPGCQCPPPAPQAWDIVIDQESASMMAHATFLRQYYSVGGRWWQRYDDAGIDILAPEGAGETDDLALCVEIPLNPEMSRYASLRLVAAHAVANGSLGGPGELEVLVRPLYILHYAPPPDGAAENTPGTWSVAADLRNAPEVAAYV